MMPVSRWMPGFVLIALAAAGCGPTPPKVLLETPKDYPADWAGRKLYHTPQAYIYARSDLAAGEADRWAKEVKDYVQQEYKRDLGKGVIVVMEPADEPVVRTLEEERALARNPEIIPTPPRKPESIEEVRKKLAENGIPEEPTMIAATVPLTKARLRQMGLEAPAAAWAVAAPSHALAAECGVPVNAGIMRKKFPGLFPTDEKALAAAEKMKDKGAQGFEITRGSVLFTVWAQQQQNWTDDQKREAIREHVRHIYRANWLPAPKEEDLEW